jgi:hypothetical protein
LGIFSSGLGGSRVILVDEFQIFFRSTHWNAHAIALKNKNRIAMKRFLLFCSVRAITGLLAGCGGTSPYGHTLGVYIPSSSDSPFATNPKYGL